MFLSITGFKIHTNQSVTSGHLSLSGLNVNVVQTLSEILENQQNKSKYMTISKQYWYANIRNWVIHMIGCANAPLYNLLWTIGADVDTDSLSCSRKSPRQN